MLAHPLESQACLLAQEDDVIDGELAGSVITAVNTQGASR